MTQLRAAGLSKEAEAKLKRGAAITQVFIQEKNKPVSMEELIVHLYVLSRGILDDLSVAELKKFKKDFFELFKNQYPQVVASMSQTEDLTQEIKDAVNAVLKKYFEME